MADLQKLLEKAEKYRQKQRYDAAYETYQEIYKFDPQNDAVLLALAEFALKLNRASEAARYYGILVDFYIRRNDAARGIATCRKLLKLQPQDGSTQAKLAHLLERTQKTSEALEAFRAAIPLQRSSGTAAALLDSLDRVAKLDPTNLDAQAELAAEAAKQNQPQLGGPAYLNAARLAREQGANDRWAEYIERAYALDPTNEPAAIGASEVRIQKGEGASAVTILEPLAASKPEDIEILRLLATAYLAAKQYAKAEPTCWKVFQTQPAAVALLQRLVEGYLTTDDTSRALHVASEIKSRMVSAGKQNEYVKLVEEIYEKDQSSLPVLEILAELYNEMNREEPLRRMLTQLFSLYLGAESYDKAGETLEKLLDVDPYGVGHEDRLLNLEGHLDPTWYRNIADRIRPLAAPAAAPGGEDSAAEAEAANLPTMEDLIVEAEMFHQYQLPAKLREAVEKIDRYYPGSYAENARVRELFDAAKYTPKHTPKATESASAKAAPASPAETPQTYEELARMSGITANIYREGTPHGVMRVAVTEIGRTLGASRCWGALGTAGPPPTLTVEYCDPVTPPAAIQTLLRMFGVLMNQVSSQPEGWLVENVHEEPALGLIATDIDKIGIRSLLVLPLFDKDELAGLLLVQQCDRERPWSQADAILLRTIAPQIVVAVNNTKLRRLVRSLAGTDPETGLLPRGSYIDCLLSEAQRAREQSQPLSICLIEPDHVANLAKTLGDEAIQKYFGAVAKAVSSNLRQNDIAIRYSPVTIAVLFPDTALPQGALAVEKLRRILSNIKPDGSPPFGSVAAVCNLNVSAGFDPVDGVTEVINRLQFALEQARKQGSKQIVVSQFKE